MSRRALLAFVGAAAVCLLPWTVYLALSLPNRHGSDSWKVAWVGFDTGLLLLFAAATVLGLRRRRAAVPLLAATAALLCADAWFDVVLDWDAPDRWVSVAMALLLELPLAILLLLHQRVVLAGGPAEPACPHCHSFCEVVVTTAEEPTTSKEEGRVHQMG